MHMDMKKNLFISTCAHMNMKKIFLCPSACILI